MPTTCETCEKPSEDCRCHADDPTEPIPLDQSPPRMKSAREVAVVLAGEHDGECLACVPKESRQTTGIPGLYDCECGRDERVYLIADALEAARREGFEAGYRRGWDSAFEYHTFADAPDDVGRPPAYAAALARDMAALPKEKL